MCTYRHTGSESDLGESVRHLGETLMRAAARREGRRRGALPSLATTHQPALSSPTRHDGRRIKDPARPRRTRLALGKATCLSPSPASGSLISSSLSRSIQQEDDLVEVSVQPTDSTHTAIGHQEPAPSISHPLAAPAAVDDSTASSSSSSSPPQQDDPDLVELLWSKSAVYLHPSPHPRDHIPGFLSLVRLRSSNAHLVSWVPESLVEGTRDYDAYVLVELSSQNERDVLVHLAPSFTVDSAAQSRAFSHPVTDLYSLRVEPPTLTYSWVGSITLSLFGGHTLAPLHFHDDESKSTLLDRDARVTALGVDGSHTRQHGHARRASLPPSWGGEAFLAQLRQHARLVRSQLDSSVWLVNPSRDDLEAHVGPAAAAREDEAVPLEAMRGVRARTSILHQSSPVSSSSSKGKGPASRPAEPDWPDDPDAVLSPAPRSRGSGGASGRDDSGGMDALTFSILSGFSRVTRNARHMSQQAASTVLSHPLAKPLAKHVPKPIAQFALAPGEVSRLTDAAGVGVRRSPLPLVSSKAC